LTPSQIERAAEQVLAAHRATGLPVDPLALARLEDIRLAPGRYGGCFEGRIEYRGDTAGGRVLIFYEEEAPPRRPASRVRFSVAHELGHYFLPPHRQYLFSGHWHGRHAAFLLNRRLEREANYFAGALLMPRERFIECARRRSGGLCTLRDLAYLAGHVFQTSLTSTAIRYMSFAPKELATFATRSEPGGWLPGESSSQGTRS
jgi:hypothetical protein